MDPIKELLTRSIDKIYPTTAALEKELSSGRRLRIYLGVDPTGPHLHLGHATNLLLLKALQKLGHEIIFLIGDFTAMIGDPTDKLSPRQPLTKEEVKQNLKTFKAQASKILPFAGENPVQIRFNSEWHAKMKFEDVVKIAEHITVPQMLARDMFQERLKTGGTVHLNEFLYPLMQGYDSVALDVDLEIGGTDQTFNMLVGRDLMRVYKQKEKFVVTTKLLVDPTTGKKIMNKSEGGLVNLDDAPDNMFGKIMALNDSAITPIAEFSTNMPFEEIQKLTKEKNPRDAKLRVAHEVVKTYHDKKAADTAQEKWVGVFSKKEVDATELQEFKIKIKRLSILELVLSPQTAARPSLKSKSEARRLIEQGAIEVNGIVKKDYMEIIDFTGGEVLKIGKKKFFRIKIG